MALTEQKVLDSVKHNKIANTFDVVWANQILKDGVIIASTPHACAYCLEQKALFIADLGPDANSYITAAGW